MCKLLVQLKQNSRAPHSVCLFLLIQFFVWKQRLVLFLLAKCKQDFMVKKYCYYTRKKKYKMMYVLIFQAYLFFSTNIYYVNCEDITTQMLKQAADEMMQTLDILPESNQNNVQSYHGLKVTPPSQMDLLARRLQLKLIAQIQDNWLALTDPQRFAILSSKDPLVQILLSFQDVVKEMDVLEAATEINLVVSQLNGLDVENDDIRRIWFDHWDFLKQYMNGFNQLYTYFQRFCTSDS